jgi:hypothetical protein
MYTKNNKVNPYVFGIGFPKTGTSSLTDALNILDIPTVHSCIERGKSKKKIKIKTVVSDNQEHRRNLLHSIDQEYRGFTDFGGEYTYQELYTQYPDSLFIYTTREFVSWFESFVIHYRKKIVKFGSQRFQDSDLEHVNMVKRYFERTEAIRKFFRDKQDQYLELDICAGEGWEKLCGFLKVAVPAEPFPHTNIAKHDLETLVRLSPLIHAKRKRS